MKKINVIMMKSEKFDSVAVLAMKSEEKAAELKAELNSVAEEKNYNKLRTLMVENTMIIPSALQGKLEELKKEAPDVSFYVRQCMLK